MIDRLLLHRVNKNGRLSQESWDVTVSGQGSVRARVVLGVSRGTFVGSYLSLMSQLACLFMLISLRCQSEECIPCPRKDIRNNPAQKLLRDGWVQNCDLSGITPEIVLEV